MQGIKEKFVSLPQNTNTNLTHLTQNNNNTFSGKNENDPEDDVIKEPHPEDIPEMILPMSTRLFNQFYLISHWEELEASR